MFIGLFGKRYLNLGNITEITIIESVDDVAVVLNWNGGRATRLEGSEAKAMAEILSNMAQPKTQSSIAVPKPMVRM